MSPQPFDVKYQTLFENFPLSIVLLNSNGEIIEINSITEEIYGVERELILYKHYTDLFIVSDENSQKMKKIFKDVLAGKKYGPKDIQLLTQNGEKIWITLVGSLIQVGDNQVIQIITQNIDQRKILEQSAELIESEERFRNLAESLPEVIFEIDLDYKITYTNSIASKIFGYSNEEFKKGMKIFQFLTLDDKQSVLKQTQQIFRGEYVKPLVLKLKRKDGTFFFSNIYASRIFRHKKVVGVRCIIHDISEMKISQEKIKESEEKYRLLAENANDLITVVNFDNQIEYVNDEAHKRIMGYTSEDLLNHNYMEFVHPKDRNSFLKTINQKGNLIEAQIKHKDGHYIWIETGGNFFKDENGKTKNLTISRDITERKETAQKLIESQKKYKDLANSLPEVIFEIDLKYNLTYTNRIASQIFGYSHEDFKKGLNIFNFISPEEKEQVLESLRHIFKGELGEPLILQLRRKDGSFFYGTINATPIFKGSKIVGIRSVIHDVTDMINAEEKIKESEARFRSISEQSLMGICIIQLDRVKYVNKTLTEMLGYSTEELLSWGPGGFFKTIHPKDKKRIIELATKTGNRLESGVNYYEARGIHKNGNVIWLEVHSKIILFQKKPAFLVSFIDISERKNAKEELKESEEKYRFLFEKSPVSILLIDTNGKIEDCNSSLEKLINFDRSEIIGKPYANLNVVFPEYLPILLKRLKIIANGGYVDPIDIKIKDKDGKTKWATVDTSLLKLVKEPLLLVIVYEISATKELEIKLKDLDEMRREFIDRASHELKTPITTVYGAYQLLNTLYKHKFKMEELELLEMAFSGTKRLKKLVDDLLDVSKLESRMFKLDKIETNLSGLIKDCVTELNYLIKKRDQEIEFDIPGEFMINIDRLRIELVLTNLLTNSIKYTPIKGKIIIRLNKIKDYAELTVEDTGIGLTKSEIEKLFKRFTKIPNPYDDKIDIDLGSTGLGLHIAKSLIDLHGGTITVKSAGKNKGSTFTVCLPFNE